MTAIESGAPVAWIAVDWGTTRLRVWAMDAKDRALGRVESHFGMRGLRSGLFESALLTLLTGEKWLTPGKTLTVVICGMAGAREGWVDASYRDVPARPADGARAVRAPSTAPGLQAWILPGLKQNDPPDVMRGEETQIAGLLVARPDFDGWATLPGTHSKWARVVDGRVESFFTAMTGELFDVLGEHSILRRSLDKGESWDWAQFDDALDGALANPAGLIVRLFGLRPRALLQGLEPGGVRARLSGELIGAEIAYAVARAERRPVALIGAAALSQAYARALRRAGFEVEVFDADALTLAGLMAAKETMPNA